MENRIIRRWWRNRAVNRICPITHSPVHEIAEPFRIVNEGQRVEVYELRSLVISLHFSSVLVTPLTRKTLNAVELLRMFHICVRKGWFAEAYALRVYRRGYRLLRKHISDMCVSEQRDLKRKLWTLFYSGLRRDKPVAPAHELTEKTDADNRFKQLAIRHLLAGRRRTLALLSSMQTYLSAMGPRKQRRVWIKLGAITAFRDWCERFWPCESVYQLQVTSPPCLLQLLEEKSLPNDAELDFYQYCLDRVHLLYDRHVTRSTDDQPEPRFNGQPKPERCFAGVSVLLPDVGFEQRFPQ